MASPWTENLFKGQHNSAPLEYCTSNSIPNHMGTKTKSHRLDPVMLNAVISQANSERQMCCMMISEVTQAQPFQWVMEPLLPSAGSKV